MERTGHSHMGCFGGKYKRNRNNEMPSRGKSREQKHFARDTQPTSTLHSPLRVPLVPKKNAVTVTHWRRTVGPCAVGQRNGASLMACDQPLAGSRVLGCDRGQDIAIGSRLTTVIGSTVPSANARRRAPSYQRARAARPPVASEI